MENISTHRYNIGLIGPINPQKFKNYIESGLDIKSINSSLAQIDLLCSTLLQNGHNVFVITEDKDSEKDYIYKGDHLQICIIGTKKMHLLKYIKLRFIVSRKIERMVKLFPFADLWHAQWSYEYAYAIRRIKQPKVCTVRDWAPYMFALANSKETFRGLVKKITWIPKLYMNSVVLNNNNFKLIANSDYTCTLLKGKYRKQSPTTINNAISLNEILKFRDEPFADFTIIAISASLDNPLKNITSLIDALLLLHKQDIKAKLVLIGNYDPNREVYIKSKQMDILDYIQFTGPLEHHELMCILKKAHCLVHPSVEESFGNTLIEAMSKRIPVIGGKYSGAVPYVLKHGECGQLCDIKNPVEISRAILNVYKNNSMISQMVAAATDVVTQEYSETVLYNKHIEVYRSVLGR